MRYYGGGGTAPNGRQYRYYKHAASTDSGINKAQAALMKRHGCRSFRVRSDDLETAVATLIRAMRASPEWIAGVKRAYGTNGPHAMAVRESLAQSQVASETAKGEVDAGLDALLRTSLPRATEELMRRLEQSIQRVERLGLEVASAKARVGNAVLSFNEVSRVLHETCRILDAFDREPAENRRKVFGWWIDTVEIVVEMEGSAAPAGSRRRGHRGTKPVVSVSLRATPNLQGSIVLIPPGPEAFVADRIQATFPTLLVAGLAKARPAELWEIEDAAERAVPKVDLSLNKPQ